MANNQDMAKKVLDTSAQLYQIETAFGKSSDQYKKTLNDFASAWYVLKSSHGHDDLLL